MGINLGSQLHMSETVRLRNEDSDISPYRSLCEPLLYYDGHVQLDIPIKVDGVTVQVGNNAFLATLCSTSSSVDTLQSSCCVLFVVVLEDFDAAVFTLVPVMWLSLAFRSYC